MVQRRDKVVQRWGQIGANWAQCQGKGQGQAAPYISTYNQQGQPATDPYIV